ncbi:sensor histidine kinase [Planctomycetota bacterium]
MGSEGRAAGRHPPATWRGARWSLAVGVAAWVVLGLLCLLGGRSGAASGTVVVLMALVAFWDGWTLGRPAGAITAATCLLIAALALPWLGVVDGMGLAIGLFAAGLGSAWLREQRLGEQKQLAGARAEVAALRESLDETRRELADVQRRLREAERLATVGTMSAQIAHQLRNPLTSIGLYIQLVEDELRDLGPEKAREAIELLERVLNEQRVLVEITDNYLRYARLPDIQASRLDVNRTVGELVRFLRHELERNGIAISTGLGEGLAAVEADRRLLRFALMNLLKNASEAMGPGGRLRVRTVQHNGAVEIQVSDTGPGIPADDLAHVFEPFYTTKDAGSGLGLSLSRQIVEKHAGTLTCESMVGVGTTFTVHLPVLGGERETVHGDGQARDGPDR